MTPKQTKTAMKIAHLTFNRYISEQESYIAIINLIDQVRCDGVIDINFKEIKE